MKTLLAASAAIMMTATAAWSVDDRYGNRLNVPHSEWLGPSEMAEKLTSQGYKVHKIESDDGAYEVDATDKNGVYMEVHVHPTTGEILPGYDD